MTDRPTLAVTIRARQAAADLVGAVEHARTYADEVLVAVDERSLDLSLEVASSIADLVVRYDEPLGLRAPRTLLVARTTCDWTLLLDPDERADETLVAALPALLGGDVTHWAVRYRSIGAVFGSAGLRPGDPRPGPSQEIRLVRADSSLVWESPVPEQGLRVIGARGDFALGGIDQVGHRREVGREKAREFTATTSVTPGGSGPEAPGAPAGGQLVPGVMEIGRLLRYPPFHAILSVHALAGEVPIGESVFAELDARNSGALRWPVPGGEDWPRLALVCRHTDESGSPIEATAQHFPLAQETPPGATTRFRCSVTLPPVRGHHLLHWEMVSEGDVWFGDCGAEPITTMVRTR